MYSRPQKGPLALSSRVVVRGARVNTKKRARVTRKVTELPRIRVVGLVVCFSQNEVFQYFAIYPSPAIEI